MVGILVSFGDGLFQGAMLASGRVHPWKWRNVSWIRDHSKPLSSKHHFSRGWFRQTSKFHCFTAKSTEPSEIFLKCCCACHQFDNSLELISLYCGNPLEIYRTNNYTRSFKASSHVEVLRHAPLLTVASAGLVWDPILVLTIVSWGNSHTIHPPLPFLTQARSVLDGTTSPNVGAMHRGI